MADFYSLATNYKVSQPFWTHQQRDSFDRSVLKPRYAIWHEPRCGKSKIVVDTCRYHYYAPDDPLHIDGLLVIAWPNGAHHGWVLDAFPDAWAKGWSGFMWDTDRANNKSYQQEFADFLQRPGFKVFAIGADSLKGDECKKYIGRFMLAVRRLMLVGDESSFMAEKKSLRTKLMHSIAQGAQASRFVVMKRILDGTPVDRSGPLDYFAQMGLLGFDILGYRNEVEFRKFYAEIETQGRQDFWVRVNVIQDEEKVNREEAIRRAKKQMKRGEWWEAIKEVDGQPQFRNMDLLWKRMDPFSDRATFADCFPNAVRPNYIPVEFDLTPEQRRVYEELATSYKTELHDGASIEATHQLTRILRLQQIGSNYYPETSKLSLHGPCAGLGCEACSDTGIIESIEPLRLIDPSRNPRLDALASLLTKQKGPVIIWARFKQDIDQCMDLCRRLGRKPVQYDGRIKGRDKLEARKGFQNFGLYDAFVANQAAASRGLPLHRAEWQAVYSNIFSFRTRRQMEERSEHGAKTFGTDIYDLTARNTVDDMAILPALRQGMDVSSYVLRDARRVWL
jgi:hypothetical protein